MLQSFLILSIADKGLQLVTEHGHALFVIYARYSLIHKLSGSRIFLVDFSIVIVPSRLELLIRSDRHGKIVPPIITIQQTIIVILVAPREENQEPPLNKGRKFIHHFFDL